jgi:hypothetical protein
MEIARIISCELDPTLPPTFGADLISCPASKLYFLGGRDAHPTRIASNLTIKFRCASPYHSGLTAGIDIRG